MDQEGTCRGCPEGVKCEEAEKLETLELKPGYFRATAESTEVYPCTMGEAACPGGNKTGDELCNNGYEGPLCDMSVTQQGRECRTSHPISRTPPDLLTLTLPLISTHLSCQDEYYFDSYSLTCSTCSDGAQAAAPLIVLGSIITLGGGVAAYTYKFHYDDISAYFEARKARLFVLMNQGTIVVSASSNHMQSKSRFVRMCSTYLMPSHLP